MSVPLSADRFIGALKAEGLTVVEVGGWRTRNRNHKGPWGPVHGVMLHHTVTHGTAYTVRLCRDGDAALPGPLCHGVITKDGRVHLVGHGRTNHAGAGDSDVLAAVIAEKRLPPDQHANTDGNRHFYGFECENLGDGEDPWPAPNSTPWPARPPPCAAPTAGPPARSSATSNGARARSTRRASRWPRCAPASRSA